MDGDHNRKIGAGRWTDPEQRERGRKGAQKRQAQDLRADEGQPAGEPGRPALGQPPAQIDAEADRADDDKDELEEDGD